MYFDVPGVDFPAAFLFICSLAGIPREEVREALIARLNVQGDVQKRTPKVVIKEIPECPLTDVDSRSATYEAFLAKLSLSSDHRQNLRDRGSYR